MCYFAIKVVGEQFQVVLKKRLNNRKCIKMSFQFGLLKSKAGSLIHLACGYNSRHIFWFYKDTRLINTADNSDNNRCVG